MAKKAKPLVQGRDYWCGCCIGRKTVPCPDCMDGCEECSGRGRVQCGACRGGQVPVPPPDWL
ncbi:hypothetical protein ACF06O_30740 [Streptomyces albidoflavus]